MLDNLQSDNYCKLSAQGITDKCGVSQPTVSRAINGLEAQCLIYRINRTIIVDPNYCWRGDVASHYKAMQAHSEHVPYYSDAVSRAINGLEAQCLIYRINRTIIVDPNYCWRGDVASHYKAMQAHSEHVPYYSDVMSRLGYLPF